MIVITPKTGLILSTYNKPNILRPLSLVSTVIKWVTRGKYTHTATLIPILGRWYVIESDWRGIIPVTFDKWKRTKSYIHIFDPNALNEPDQADLFIKKMLGESGKMYDYEKLIDEAKRGVIRNFRKDKRYKVVALQAKDDDTFICSEYIAWGYNTPEWWIATPIKVWDERFINFPNGKDLGEGKPQDIEFN